MLIHLFILFCSDISMFVTYGWVDWAWDVLRDGRHIVCHTSVPRGCLAASISSSCITMYIYIYSIWQTEFTNEIRREFSIRAGVGVSLFEDWYNPNGSSVHRVSGGKTEAQKMPKTEASTTYAMKHGKIVRIQWKMVPVLWTKISPHYQRPLVMWVKQS